MTKQQPRKKQRHVPQRTCVSCRLRYDKRRLTRIVRTEGDGVVVDPTGKRNGRGAYICDRLTCWDNVIDNKNLLDQALKSALTPAEREALASYRNATKLVME